MVPHDNLAVPLPDLGQHWHPQLSQTTPRFLPTSGKRICPLSESHTLETHVHLFIMGYYSQGDSEIQSYQNSILPVIANAFFVNPYRALHQVCIILRNIFWEMLNNVPDYGITIIPKSCRQEQEAEQKRKPLSSEVPLIPLCLCAEPFSSSP